MTGLIIAICSLVTAVLDFAAKTYNKFPHRRKTTDAIQIIRKRTRR